MLRLVFVLVCVMLLGLVIPIGIVGRVQAATEESFTVSPSLMTVDFMDPSQSMEAIRQVTVSNKGDTTKFTSKVERYRILTDTEIYEGKRYADLLWVDAQPSVVSIPGNSTAAVNVYFNIPAGTEDGNYITYLSVSWAGGQSQYITIDIRLGEAIPVSKYAISPGMYTLAAGLDKVRFSDDLPITIENQGRFSASYEVYAKLPDSPDTVDPDWRVGDPAWITITGGNLTINPGRSENAYFRVDLPSSVAPGKYKVWILARDTTQGTNVQIDYACKVFLNVAGGNGKSVPWTYIYIGVGALVVVLVSTFIFLRRRSKRKEVLGL